MFSVINTISFFSKRVSFDWVLEGLNIPQVPFKDPLGILKGLLGGLFLSVKTRKRTRKIQGEDKDRIPKFQHNSFLEN